MAKDIPYKTYLSEKEIPRKWYNVTADMPNKPQPPLHPGTKQPAQASDFQAIFPDALIAQEMSPQRYIDIPEEVSELYRLYRPSPMCRAYMLEKALGTPAHIYYKYEGNNPSGSHKLNTSIPQAYYNKQQGLKRLATETGAGQWGTALSVACALFGLGCSVYMVRVSYEQKPYRRIVMQTYGADVTPSPSNKTNAGRAILAKDPDCPGSLGIAISEAVEDAASHDDTNYSLGSVLNHVLLHQSVIGEEALLQFEKIGEYPDIVIGCCGGGSNFGGTMSPFLRENLTKGKKTRLIAVEPTACPSLTRGRFTYDFGDASGYTPLMPMYTLGNGFIPSKIHAGGLRYHADSPIISQLYKDKLIEAQAVGQKSVFEAAMMFALHEIIIPAPESAHAIRTAIDEALKCKKTGEEKVIMFTLSGHGNFDMTAYDMYLSGKMDNEGVSEEVLQKGFGTIPKL
ncbi:MAG: TrpB-like pyridoxal phosphate-dependent enzyme [Bacillota bacterium]|nr:TrpB-like pyridoxal phosphate-dependent enzyme [Bacillota bacterium]